MSKVNPMQNDKQIVEIYDDGRYLENNADWHSEDSPWKAGHIQQILSRNHILPRTLCEVGCGAGEILRQLSLHYPDCRFSGYEVSQTAFEMCRARQAENITFHMRDILTEDSYFDCLMCIDVFEHVENYFGFIRGLKSKAHYKIFHIPLDLHVVAILRESMMELRHKVGHIHYFSKRTALATLEDCGLEIVDSFFTPHFIGRPANSLKERFKRIPRHILHGLSPELQAKILGHSSLLVLAK